MERCLRSMHWALRMRCKIWFAGLAVSTLVSLPAAWAQGSAYLTGFCVTIRDEDMKALLSHKTSCMAD